MRTSKDCLMCCLLPCIGFTWGITWRILEVLIGKALQNRISACNQVWEWLQPQTCNSRSCSVCLSSRGSDSPVWDTCWCQERVQGWCNVHSAHTVLAVRKAGAFWRHVGEVHAKRIVLLDKKQVSKIKTLARQKLVSLGKPVIQCMCFNVAYIMPIRS